MKNARALDLGLLDEPFTRSCTAHDDIRQKIPNESEYDVTVTSQNANSIQREYMMSNAFTNQGLTRLSTNIQSGKKTRPGTQHHNHAAVTDAYNGNNWFDLNASITGNSAANYLRTNSDVPKINGNRGRFQKNPMQPAEYMKAKLSEEKEKH